MAPALRTIKVAIMGRQYTFASRGEETDRHIQQVAELVDAKMREVQYDGSTPIQTAVLAGLELVDELMHLQDEVSTVEANLSERTHRLTESLGQIFREAEEVASRDPGHTASGSDD
jgi:cell division protein ZapA (FtsZ GTPase activity inhibitor)